MQRDSQEPTTAPPGEEIRAARRARVHRIRRRVATGAVVSFLAAWGVVYAQMRLGDDPALGTGNTVAQVHGASSAANTLATPSDTSATDTSTRAGSDGASASSSRSAGSRSSSSTLVTAQS